jgi:hypothetical protein
MLVASATATTLAAATTGGFLTKIDVIIKLSIERVTPEGHVHARQGSSLPGFDAQARATAQQQSKAANH